MKNGWWTPSDGKSSHDPRPGELKIWFISYTVQLNLSWMTRKFEAKAPNSWTLIYHSIFKLNYIQGRWSPWISIQNGKKKTSRKRLMWKSYSLLKQSSSLWDDFKIFSRSPMIYSRVHIGYPISTKGTKLVLDYGS